MHILEALVKALNDVDNVIKIIKDAKTPEEARLQLIDTYDFSEVQARAILTMQLQRLTGLEIDKIHEEANNLTQKIIKYKEILANDDLKVDIIKTELQEIKDKYADARIDRKSTRLNSSHVRISYAVLCLKKKKKDNK